MTLQTSIFSEVLRVSLILTLITLGPLCLASLLGALIQAIFQVQEATSLQLLRLLVLSLTLLVASDEIAQIFIDLLSSLDRQSSLVVVQ